MYASVSLKLSITLIDIHIIFLLDSVQINMNTLDSVELLNVA